MIFIDDLDRCPPKTISKILETINLFFDSQGCIFIIGMDIYLISKSIDTYYEKSGADEFSGRNFIRKLIQLQFNLPIIRMEGIKNYIENDLVIDKNLEKYLELFIIGLERNPREIKQFLNSLNFLRMLGASIRHFDFNEELLIKWCMLDYNDEEFIREIKLDHQFLLEMQILAKRGIRCT